MGARSKDNEALFKKAWFPRGRNRGGLGVTFFEERDGQLWFGASRPWHGFADSGLYRVDLSNGDFYRYGPRDGFRYDSGHGHNQVRDGVWAQGRLWLANSHGLAEVTPRPSKNKAN